MDTRARLIGRAPRRRGGAAGAHRLALSCALLVASCATASGAAEPAPDLAYVDRASPAYTRFKSWVDAAVDGRPGYAFAASDAALMYRLTGIDKYCDLAVAMVERQVGEAETAIAAGDRPEVAGDSYLHVGPMIADLSQTFESCNARLDQNQKQRWSAYAEQAVWNVWHHRKARWGDHPHPWTGWATDNPGNNYYYSFVEATMRWALASGSDAWMTDLRERRLPPLQAYFAELAGGGSREGTGYGASHMWLFALYRMWRDATGEDLSNTNSHARDSIDYWVHATVPTRDRFAPLGDQSRNSVPELFDYHRRVVLEARQLVTDPGARELADWWLGNISVKRMEQGFNLRHELLPSGGKRVPPDRLIYLAEGTGHLFARTGWDTDAMWLAFVAGPYRESHAHQDQGSFTLFERDWLAVTENIWSHSGIQQGTEVHNVVRFERADRGAQQCQSPSGDVVVHQCYPTRSKLTLTPGTEPGAFTAVADLTPAYRNNPALRRWQRGIEFGAGRLTVSDSFDLAEGTRAVFQLNVPVKPKIDGREASAGRLRIKVLEPENATLSVHRWHDVDADEFRRGWRIDVAGGERGYVVQLDTTGD